MAPTFTYWQNNCVFSIQFLLKFSTNKIFRNMRTLTTAKQKLFDQKKNWLETKHHLQADEESIVLEEKLKDQ